jgi:hypothetical protein
MNVNARYKDSVFSLLFGNPDAVRELYSAIEGVAIPPDTPVEINTLSDILYMDQVNDLSFTVDNRLVVLIEHQSTVNPNMPLRLLLYIARVYEKIIDRAALYKTKLEKIPAPEFIVLYNGKEPYPDRGALRLSDAFRDSGGLLKAGNRDRSLELAVRVYNINNGHNNDILEKSRTLGGYSAFVSKVREFNLTLPFDQAMKEALNYCIDHNILKHFLEIHGTEVRNMLLTEWNMEDAKTVWLKEGREDGYKDGREEGREEIVRNALIKGFSLETVQEISGLSIETIRNIKASL